MSQSQGEAGALRLEVLDGSVGLVTFDLPGESVNTLGRAVMEELEALAAGLARRTDLKGLVFRSGKPGAFVAGANLNELGRLPRDPEQARRDMQRGLAVFAALEALPYPTVAAIDGAAMGGGLELALSFDFRVATNSPKTVLGLPEVNVGLIPGWGGTQRLPRLIGPSLAAEMICSGEPVGATRARDIGLVFDAVPAERLLEESLRVLDWARETGAWTEAR